MSQFAEPVIPDERRLAVRDPESSEGSMTSFGVWFPAFAGTLSGSRLASAASGLGRDDELRRSLLRGEGTCNYPEELSEQALSIILFTVLQDGLDVNIVLPGTRLNSLNEF